jgi:hypothetical protein
MLTETPEAGQYVTLTPTKCPNGQLDYSFTDGVYLVVSVNETCIMLQGYHRGDKALLRPRGRHLYAQATPDMVRATWGDEAADACTLTSVQRAELAALLGGIEGLDA